jgi:2-C-methyl-D-erythritol 2,4-cyclodiphosphate synthase
MFRVGLGYDIHRLKKGRPLLLGGVKIPHDKGLDGHSDADVLLHAITDALLGAAALPDIGFYFPPSNKAIQGIDSRRMLAKAFSEVKKKGFSVVNVDSVVIGEAPKIAPYREAIRASIARLLQIQTADIQVKGKTNEGLDAIGKRQALAAQAVILIERRLAERRSAERRPAKRRSAKRRSAERR